MATDDRYERLRTSLSNPAVFEALNELRNIETALDVRFRCDGQRLLLGPRAHVTEDLMHYVRRHRDYLVEVVQLRSALRQLFATGDTVDIEAPPPGAPPRT